MPELPDVEVYRRQIDDAMVGKEVDDIVVNESKIIKLSGKKLKAYAGQKATETRRIGKNCFVKMGHAGWLSLHFGMTGTVEYTKKDEATPDYSALAFHLKQGGSLHITSRRKLGKVETCGSPEKYAEAKDLGSDAMEVSEEAFLKLLSNKQGSIKGALMDQSMIAGLGNVYVDEILFQCRIHPKAKVKDLSGKDYKKLFNIMHKVVDKAIEVDADPDKLPTSYLTGKRREGEKCPSCDGKIEKIKVGGRSGYYCPECQKR